MGRINLFESTKVGGVELRNRFMRSATHEWLASDEGYVTDRMLDFYQTLARGEIGLIVPGYSYIEPTGKSSKRQGAIYDDSFIPGYKKLTDVVHEEGGAIALQIVHGGRQVKPDLIEGDAPLAPSEVRDSSTGIIPREMTDEEIARIKTKFVEAVERSRKAGFDAVQLHIAHGFLLSEFISPYTNRRNDRWGGSTENRCRLILEIIEGARKKVGDDFPIFAKLNSTDGIEGGLSAEESARVAALLSSAGVSLIEVSGGIGEAGEIAARSYILQPEDEAYFASGARLIKQAVGERTKVALVGGLRSLEVMQRMVDNGNTDIVSMSRPFIREPDLVLKLKKGKKQKGDCISCNGCYCPDGIRCVILESESA